MYDQTYLVSLGLYLSITPFITNNTSKRVDHVVKSVFWRSQVNWYMLKGTVTVSKRKACSLCFEI